MRLTVGLETFAVDIGGDGLFMSCLLIHICSKVDSEVLADQDQAGYLCSIILIIPLGAQVVTSFCILEAMRGHMVASPDNIMLA